MNKPIYSTNLKKARNGKGLTQKQLAARIFKDQSTYARIESGELEPSNDTWLLLCEILNITDLIKFMSEDFTEDATQAA